MNIRVIRIGWPTTGAIAGFTYYRQAIELAMKDELAKSKELAIMPDPIQRQTYLHQIGWTALDNKIRVPIEETARIWEETKLVLGWAPPDPGPAERAWRLNELGLKAVRRRTQKKIAKGHEAPIHPG